MRGWRAFSARCELCTHYISLVSPACCICSQLERFFSTRCIRWRGRTRRSNRSSGSGSTTSTSDAGRIPSGGRQFIPFAGKLSFQRWPLCSSCSSFALSCLWQTFPTLLRPRLSPSPQPFICLQASCTPGRSILPTFLQRTTLRLRGIARLPRWEFCFLYPCAHTAQLIGVGQCSE